MSPFLTTVLLGWQVQSGLQRQACTFTVAGVPGLGAVNVDIGAQVACGALDMAKETAEISRLFKTLQMRAMPAQPQARRPGGLTMTRVLRGGAKSLRLRAAGCVEQVMLSVRQLDNRSHSHLALVSWPSVGFGAAWDMSSCSMHCSVFVIKQLTDLATRLR